MKTLGVASTTRTMDIWVEHTMDGHLAVSNNSQKDTLILVWERNGVCNQVSYESRICNPNGNSIFALFEAESEDACLKEQSAMKGPRNVGFAGQCPSPSYKDGSQCCCGEGCCWNKCTWDNPPNGCLNGLYKAHWLFDSDKEQFFAVNYWQNSSSMYLVSVNYYSSFPFWLVSDCGGKIKPKECVVETFLVGQKDVDGNCPSPTHKYRDHCCCEGGCCWNQCPKDKANQSCLQGVPSSQWVFNTEKLWYQAVRNFDDKGLSYLIIDFTKVC